MEKENHKQVTTIELRSAILAFNVHKIDLEMILSQHDHDHPTMSNLTSEELTETKATLSSFVDYLQALGVI